MGQKLLRCCVWLCLAVSMGGWTPWLVGRICNDRWRVTQYCYWMPTPLVLVGAGACVGLASLLALGTARPRCARRSRMAVWVCVGITLAVMLREWHAQRYFIPTQDAGDARLRVLAWNPATDFINDFAERVATVPATVLAITNRPAYTKWEALRDHVGGARSMARFEHLSVVSGFRILRWGGTHLGITDAVKRTTLWPGGGEVSQDHGEALFCELDTRREFGRTTILWMIDIPSDWQLCRAVEFGQAAATLKEFKGPTFTRTEANLDVQDLPGVEPDGFPAPDIIVGDFNTPRGSWSISQLTGDARHAFELAGRGWEPTWRRDYPLLSIDQAFVSRRFDVASYRTRDMGAGWHRAQEIVLMPAK